MDELMLIFEIAISMTLLAIVWALAYCFFGALGALCWWWEREKPIRKIIKWISY